MGVRSVVSIALFCVLAAAGAALAEDEATVDQPAPAAVNLEGRWEGRAYELARSVDCAADDQPCTLTLDLVRCTTGWCGVEVTGAERRCGATALKLDGGSLNPAGPTLFKGTLELAKGTEPYVVEAYLLLPTSAEDKTEFQIAGDTGGEFRVFRRSFPFNATLARVSGATCKPETTVSSLE